MLLSHWFDAVVARLKSAHRRPLRMKRRNTTHGTSLNLGGSRLIGLDVPTLATTVECLEDRSLMSTASLAFTSSVSSGAEGSMLLVSVTLTTDAPLLGTFTANVSITDINSEVTDRTLNTTTVTFAAGSLNGATFDVSLTLADDTLVEGDETLTLTLSNPVSA